MTSWDLHPVVLAHLERFFGAARRATASAPPDGFGTAVGLAGNLLWANSAFLGGSKDREQALGIVGAVAGTLGPSLGGGEPAVFAGVLDDLERTLLGSLDAVLAALATRATAEGVTRDSPAQLDRWVWQALFPGYPWPVGHAELEQAIRARLT